MNELVPVPDPFTADAFLDGTARPAGDSLSDMLDNLSGAVVAGELTGEEADVASMVAEITAASTVGSPSARRRLTARAGALAAAGILVSTGVAAAAGLSVPIVSGVVSPAEDPVLIDIVVDEPEGNPEGEEADAGGEAEIGSEPGDGISTDSSSGEPVGSDSVDTPGNSRAARADCGRHGSVETEDPECDEAQNHGKFVSDAARSSNHGKGGASSEVAREDKSSNPATTAETAREGRSNNGKPSAAAADPGGIDGAAAENAKQGSDNEKGSGSGKDRGRGG